MVRMCHATCRSALEKAVQDGLIRMNPAIGCKLPPKKAREMQVLTREETPAVSHSGEGRRATTKLFLLDLATGLRRGELLALQWDDLNFETGVLNDHQAGLPIRGGLAHDLPSPRRRPPSAQISLPSAARGHVCRSTKRA
ncbi:MAG: hypothetical protein ACLT1A_06670 [Dysosmobacter sp.]